MDMLNNLKNVIQKIENNFFYIIDVYFEQGTIISRMIYHSYFNAGSRGCDIKKKNIIGYFISREIFLSVNKISKLK